MKLLIVDDHAVVREGIAALLRLSEPGVEVLQAASGADGLELAQSHPDLDVVMLDLAMPGLDGLSALAEFSRRRPDLPVIVLSASEDPAGVRRALHAGALGYVPKSASPTTLISAVKWVLSGEVYLPRFMRETLYPPPPPPGDPAASADGISALTERQREVLRQVTLGLSNKEIARAFCLSEKTVKAHVGAIFKALGVVNRTQAAGVARKAGLI
jgi:DNA-binding NarL/FixJ family response regulator